MAKLPIRPRPVVDSSPTYNRVLANAVPTPEQEISKNDFLRALSQAKKDQPQPVSSHRSGDVLPSRAATSQNGWTQQSGVNNAPPVPDTTGKRDLLPDPPPVQMREAPGPAIRTERKSTSNAGPAAPNSPNRIPPRAPEQASEPAQTRGERRRKQPELEGALTETLRTGLAMTTPADSIGLLDSPAPHSSLQLGTFATIDAMWRQAELVENDTLSRGWNFTLQQPGVAAIQISLRDDQQGRWSIQLNTSDQSLVRASVQELRASLEQRQRPVGSIVVNHRPLT